jgi:hypothetical protein
MRAFVLIGYLFFLLLGGGPNFYAITQNKTATAQEVNKLSLKYSVKCANKDESSVLIEDTDFDVEEEHLTGEEVHEDTNAQSLPQQDKWFLTWYYSISGLSLNHHSPKVGIEALASLGNRAPLYIKNQVLRI